jgi:hypothetical protein
MLDKKLRKAIEELRSKGRGGDTILAHINPREAEILKRMGGAGTINPHTGLPEFLNISDEGGTVVATGGVLPPSMLPPGYVPRSSVGGGFFGGLTVAGFADVAPIWIAAAVPIVGAQIGAALVEAGYLTGAAQASAAATASGATAAQAAAAGAAATQTATTIGTALASTGAQISQGVPADKAATNSIVNAGVQISSPTVAAKINELVGNKNVSNLVTAAGGSIVKTVVSGGSEADAIKNAKVALGAGLAGSTVAGTTGSAAAGQLAAGTTAGLLTGKTAEQSLVQGVSNIKLDSLVPDSGVTVPTEQQALAGQQDLQNELAPFEVDTTASSFDTRDIINDGSGFTPPTPLPQTPIIGSTGGNMATYDEEMNAPATELEDTNPFNYTPEEQQIIYQLAQEAGGTQNINDAYAALTQAAQQTANQSGLTVGNVLKFFQSNPNVTKGLVTAGVSAAGGLLTNQANVEAARISAQAMRDAAATAAEAQKFRPVGVTTRFGASQFGFDPTTGQLTSAGYQLTPELKAMQDRIMALSGQGLTEAEQAAGRYAPLTAGAQGLFGLGQQYLAQSPEQVAADYMARQQNLLAPSRERQFAQLQNQLFNTGRGGLSVGATGMRPSGAGGLGAASPEMEAYYNALAQQDAQLAAQATQAGQQQVQFGAGLLGSGANLLGSYTQGLTGAYSPFSTGVGVGSSLESLGQAPLDIGAQLGGRSAQAGANVGQTLLQGGLLGARTTQAASGVSPFGTALTGLANSPEAQQALAQWLNSGAGYGTNTRQLDTNANF